MFDSYSFCRPITPQVLQTGFESRPPLRASKSIDSFKRLSSKSFSSPKPPISPPPRRSSKNSPGLTQTVVTPARKHTQESPTVPDFGSAIAQSSSSSSRFSSPNSGAEETIFVGSSEIAQAVTTPDDSALMLVSRQVASPAAGLEDVPEEEESSIWMANPANCSMSGAVRHARSFPSSRLFSQPCATETSMPNVDGSATSDPILPLPQHQVEDIPQHPLRMSKRVSMAPGGMEDCWEDDIDYCYEHALEAYGDEAWDDVSRDSPFAGTVPASPFAGWDTAENVTPRGNSNTGSPYFDIPELQTEATSSAMSSSITMPGIVTPSEALPSPHVLSVPRDASGSIMFPLSPSMIIPKEYLSHGTEEDALQETLGEQEIKQPFYSTEVEGDAQSSYSQRCSSSSASKYTSSDGFSIGNRHSTSTGTGSRHRNSSSVGSIPELVPSRNSKQATEDADDLSDTGDSFLTMAEVSKNLPPIPARSPLRSRASSDSVGRTFQTMAGVRPVESGRMRSASNAALAGTRPKTHRTSYSLFPQTAPRY